MKSLFFYFGMPDLSEETASTSVLLCKRVLCMGARVIGECLAIDVAESFVGAEFEGGRHAIRVGMINDIEKTQK